MPFEYLKEPNQNIYHSERIVDFDFVETLNIFMKSTEMMIL